MTSSEHFTETLRKVTGPLQNKKEGKLEISSFLPVPNFGENIDDCSLWIILTGTDKNKLPPWFRWDDFINGKDERKIPEELESFMQSVVTDFFQLKDDVSALDDVKFSICFELKSRVDRVGAFNYFR